MNLKSKHIYHINRLASTYVRYLIKTDTDGLRHSPPTTDNDPLFLRECLPSVAS